jgi:Phosphotransferase enzyme family
MSDSPRHDPEFVRSAHTWIDGQLDRLGTGRIGEIEQPHVYVWATVMRATTDRDDVWFKANMDALRHEAAVASLLSAQRPELVTTPLAVDLDTAGEIRAERHGARRRAAVPRRGAARGGAVGQLSAYGIPETIQHDDLHDGQVFVRDGAELVMDWGDACVSHPFFTLSVTLEGVIAWGLDDEEDSEDIRPYRDAYLAPFASAYDRDARDLAAAVDVALRLGWACRAVNGHVPGDDERTHTRLRMFLDGKP